MHRRLLIFNKSKFFPSMTKWQVNSRSVVLLLIKWATSWEIFCICKAKGTNQLRVTAVKTQLCIAFVFTTYINRILIRNLYNEFSANFIIEWSRVSFKCDYIAFKVCILKQYIFYNGRRHHVIRSRRKCYKKLPDAISLNNSYVIILEQYK